MMDVQYNGKVLDDSKSRNLWCKAALTTALEGNLSLYGA
jgi:hypothetical protein